MANEKKVEKLTTEKTTETRKYFKEGENGKLIEKLDYDYNTRIRVYGVKTLQSYFQDSEKYTNRNCYKVEILLTRNGNEIDFNEIMKTNDFMKIMSMLSKNVLTAEITENYEILTGGVILKAHLIYKLDIE